MIMNEWAWVYSIQNLGFKFGEFLPLANLAIWYMYVENHVAQNIIYYYVNH